MKRATIPSFTLTSILILFSIQTIAQSLPRMIKIKGKIVNSRTNDNVVSATIVLLDSANAIIKGTSTGTDGTFIFDSLTIKPYRLSIRNIGYDHVNMQVPPAIKDQTIDIGIIHLNESANLLDEVEVKNSSPLIRQEIDRIIYNLQDDPDSKSRSVLRMIDRIPLLSLDGNEEIRLKGTTNYKIFINGRPSTMMQRNAKEVLRSMPAGTVQRIEVITNPSSKYDAEGVGGIINIVTMKNTSDGYRASVNLNEQFPVGGPNLGSIFSFKQGKFGISSVLGGNLNRSPETENTTNRTTFEGETQILNQYGLSKSNSRSGYVGLDLSYEIDSAKLIWGSVNFNANKSFDRGSQSSETDRGLFIESYILENKNNIKGGAFDATLDYQTFIRGNKNNILTMSYKYYTDNNLQDIDVLINEKKEFSTPNYKQSNNGIAREQTFQIDYVNNFKKINIEAGLKGIFRNNIAESNFELFNSSSGDYDQMEDLSSELDYDQNVLAAYNSYQYRYKNWGIKAGLRLERTDILADFKSVNTSLKQSYYNLVPALSISTRLPNAANLFFAFGQRLKRPGINRLNPFVDRSNPNFVFFGNPSLKPSVTNNIQLGYGKSGKGSFTLSAGYFFFNDVDIRVSTYDPTTNITSTTFENVGKGNALNTNLSLNYPILKKVKLNFNGNLTYMTIGGTTDLDVVDTGSWLHTISTSLAINVNEGFQINGGIYISSASPLSLQEYINGYVSSNLSLNKTILKDKLYISMGANNPFQKHRYVNVETTGSNFSQLRSNQINFRHYNINVAYNFGRLKDNIKKSKRGISNNDLSNSKTGGI